MSWHLPENVLKTLLNVYLTKRETLSEQEVSLAKRIQHCGRCDRFWLSRIAGPPRRCQHCRRRRYDTPLIDAILANTGQLGPPEVIPKLPSKPEESTD